MEKETKARTPSEGEGSNGGRGCRARRLSKRNEQKGEFKGGTEESVIIDFTSSKEASGKASLGKREVKGKSHRKRL